MMTVKQRTGLKESVMVLEGNNAISWRRKGQPTPVLLPGKFHGWRSLVVYSPWGHEEIPEPVIQSEGSQKEKNKYIFAHVHGI